jgi:hypothetical protein
MQIKTNKGKNKTIQILHISNFNIIITLVECKNIDYESQLQEYDLCVV